MTDLQKEQEEFYSTWTPQQYADWLKDMYDMFFGRKEYSIRRGYPVHDTVGIDLRDIRDEVIDIYRELPENVQLHFQEGLGIAVRTTTDEEILGYLLYLTAAPLVRAERLIPSTDVLDFAITYVKKPAEEKNDDLSAQCLCVIERFEFEKNKAAHQTFESLLVGSDFVQYTPLILVSLVRRKPEDWKLFLAMAETSITAMHQASPESEKDSWMTVKKIVDAVGIDAVSAVFSEIESDSAYGWFVHGLLHKEGPCELKDGLPVLRKKKTPPQ